MRTITSPSQIPYVTLSLEARNSVTARAEARKKLNDRTLMGGDGNATGFTGEELIKTHIPSLRQDPENRNYDFFIELQGVIPGRDYTILTPEHMRFTFDVKSRRIKAKPGLNFDCKVPAYQVKRQKCDAYIFTAPHESMAGGWLLGWAPKDHFKTVATLAKKGQKHASGFTPKEDHYIITVADLYPISELVGTTQRFSMSATIRSA